MWRFRFLSAHEAVVARSLLTLTFVTSVPFSRPEPAFAFSEGLAPSKQIDSSTAIPTSIGGLQAGATYRLVVNGTYTYNRQGDVSDAECSQGLPYRSSATRAPDDLGDLYIDGAQLTWSPVVSDSPLALCSAASPNVYTANYSPPYSTITAVVFDDIYSDNHGSLYLRVVCLVPFPDGEVFVQQGAINSGLSETAVPTAYGCSFGSQFSASSFRAAQTTSAPTANSYQCPKRPRHAAIADQAESFGYLTEAEMMIDSRDNSFFDPLDPEDPGEEFRAYDATDAYYSATETGSPWRYSGHWGIYTCNWLRPNTPYRVNVIGQYKYDQTVSRTRHAVADAECSTGYPRSFDKVPGAIAPTTSSDWIDKYVPSYYLYHASDLGVGVSLTGSEWTDHRFDYHPNPAEGLPSVTYDGFDLQFGWQAKSNFVTWTALTFAGGSWAPTDNLCSTTFHAYTTLVTGTGAPLQLVIHDFYRYYEWDNCGALSLRITADVGDYAPSLVPPTINCHYAPPTAANLVEVGARRTLTELPYYFLPPTSVVVDKSFDIQQPTITQALVDTDVYFRLASGRHTVTSALDQDGRFCTGLVTPTVEGIELAEDDCATRANGRKSHSFSNVPEDFVASQGTVRQSLNFLTETFRSKACSEGYCTIPYFCRYAPITMRGVLIVRLTD